MAAVVLTPGAAVGEAVIYAGKAKLYHIAGYRVYLDPASQLKENPEAWEFIMLKSPWISGEKHPEESDLLDGVVITRNPYVRTVHDPCVLRACDFRVEDRIFSLPYRPTPRPEFAGKVLIDLNISNYRLAPGGRDCLDNVADYVREHYPDAISIVRDGGGTMPRGFSPLPVASEFPSVNYRTIYDYADIVSSCDRIVCLQTGSVLIACSYAKRVDCLRTEVHEVQLDNPSRLVFFDCEFNSKCLLP